MVAVAALRVIEEWAFVLGEGLRPSIALIVFFYIPVAFMIFKANSKYISNSSCLTKKSRFL